jgi:hypothetical protein
LGGSITVQFAERSLPSVTLGKLFAECFLGFAECLRHSGLRLSMERKRTG